MNFFLDPEPGRNIRNIQVERPRHLYPQRPNRRNQERGQQISCLADRHQRKGPTSVEREILFKDGLGFKKIQLCEEDKEDDVMKKLADDSNFYQLKNIGGFELLRCKPNCRELCTVDCLWTVSNLRAAI